MTALALLLIGFSVFSAPTLALTHFRDEHYQGQPVSRTMGLVLLLALCGLQFAHFALLYLDRAWVDTAPYRMTLYAVAPAFFLFSQPLLRPRALPAFKPASLAHALPAAISPLLPDRLALPLAFAVGAVYLLALAQSLRALREERAHFLLEMKLLGTVFVIAIGVSILGFVQTSLPEKLFYILYAIAIGLAFILVQIALALRPNLPTVVRESVQAAYANSTLLNVDCDAALKNLQELMANGRLYEDAQLSLPSLAGHLQLSPHQLSELLNTRVGKGFSRYMREQRIGAAKMMLRDEPSASVLSIGLSVGFTSQSNFYEAFREIEGMPPGQYRKVCVSSGTARKRSARDAPE